MTHEEVRQEVSCDSVLRFQLGKEWHLVKRKCLELRTNLSAKIGSCTEINLQRNWVCKDLKMTLEANDNGSKYCRGGIGVQEKLD